MDALQTAYTDANRRDDASAAYGTPASGKSLTSGIAGGNTRFGTISFILVALIAAGIALRIINLLLDASLWEDEIFSVALAESPLVDLILATVRFDTHPPLYYLQLHMWAAFGDSDRWYILNSTLLSIASIAVIFETCRRIYDRNVGLWAAAIFAIMPLQLFFAENVRMYPMLAIFQISLWYVLQKMIEEQRASMGRLVAALCLGIAATLTHGLGFFITFFVFLHAAIRMFRRAPNKDLWFLVATYAIVALTAIYPVAIGMIRQTEGIASFDLPTIGIHLTLMLLGMDFPWPTVAGFVILPFVLALPLLEPRSRWIGGILVLLPFTVLLVISLLAKPVFIYRTLGLLLPFIAISLARYADMVFRSVAAIGQRIVVLAMAIVLLVGGINYTNSFEKRGYRDIVAAWQANSAPDAVMMTNGPSEFWAVLRYLDGGAGKRSALEVQAPVRDGMLKIKQKLDQIGAGSIGLFGSSNYAVVGDRRIYPYFAYDAASKAPTFWLLNAPTTGCAPQNAADAATGARYQTVAEIALTGQMLRECSVAVQK